MNVQDNLKTVLSEIVAAAHKAGRSAGEVKLVAVSKTRPVELIREVVEAGQVDLGENRVQEMVDKMPALPGVRWHLIGTLQRNKVKYIAPFVHLIHSVDSGELLSEINRRASQNQRVIHCLLQINISGEEQKGGLSEAGAEALLKGISGYPNVLIDGLMGMAELTEDEDVIRSQFRRLRQAAERMKVLKGPQVRMQELSMGMSGDYAIAIEEGATMVRIGSSIFGER